MRRATALALVVSLPACGPAPPPPGAVGTRPAPPTLDEWVARLGEDVEALEAPAFDGAQRYSEPALALRDAGRRGLEALREALRNPEATIRAAAADALGSGEGTAATVGVLLPLVDDPDARVRWVAARALGGFALDAIEAEQPVASRLLRGEEGPAESVMLAWAYSQVADPESEGAAGQRAIMDAALRGAYEAGLAAPDVRAFALDAIRGTGDAWRRRCLASLGSPIRELLADPAAAPVHGAALRAWRAVAPQDPPGAIPLETLVAVLESSSELEEAGAAFREIEAMEEAARPALPALRVVADRHKGIYFGEKIRKFVASLEASPRAGRTPAPGG